MEALKAAAKNRRRLEDELSVLSGRELYDATPADASGLRCAVKRMPAGALDSLRAIAQSFCSRPGAVFIGVVDQPPSVLLAASEDSGVDSGKLLKTALTQAGGRGGGAARMAQGSAPTHEALEAALALLTETFSSRPH